jgi:NADP-reducing hydrogenase subunit HndD
MDTVQLTIDNKPVVVKKGITILEAAKGMGVHIPTFVHMKLEDLNIENKPGGCRICVVEVVGRKILPLHVALKCAEGMIVNRIPSGSSMPGKRFWN